MTCLPRHRADSPTQGWLERRRYITEATRGPGLGVLLQRVHRITARTDYWWAWAGATVWQPFPIEMVGRLALCTIRSQVEQLLTPARSAPAGVERGGRRLGRGCGTASGTVGPARVLPPSAGRAPIPGGTR